MASQFKQITALVSADTYAGLVEIAREAGETVQETLDGLLERIVADDRAAHEQQEPSQ